jgi:gliding motility-associated-like protein
MILPCVTVPITLNIEEIICQPNIFVANIFTPNNDGTNDVLYPYLFSDLTIEKYSFVIYDRWGSRVFETNDMQAGWNGDFNGKQAAKGVYLWSIRYSLEGSDEEFIEYGDVLRQ